MFLSLFTFLTLQLPSVSDSKLIMILSRAQTFPKSSVIWHMFRQVNEKMLANSRLIHELGKELSIQVTFQGRTLLQFFKEGESASVKATSMMTKEREGHILIFANGWMPLSESLKLIKADHCTKFFFLVLFQCQD